MDKYRFHAVPERWTLRIEPLKLVYRKVNPQLCRLRHSRMVMPVSLWKMVLKNATESYPQKEGISSMGMLPLLSRVIAFSIRLF